MATTPAFSIKSLLVTNKNVTVEFPGIEGFKVSLSYLSRDTQVALRKKATKTSWKNHKAVEEMDEALFLSLYCEACIKGWSGFKLKHLNELAPVDVSGQDLEAEVEYTAENALALMKASQGFDAFVVENVLDLGKFTTIS